MTFMRFKALMRPSIPFSYHPRCNMWGVGIGSYLKLLQKAVKLLYGLISSPITVMDESIFVFTKPPMGWKGDSNAS